MYDDCDSFPICVLSHLLVFLRIIFGHVTREKKVTVFLFEFNQNSPFSMTSLQVDPRFSVPDCSLELNHFFGGHSIGQNDAVINYNFDLQYYILFS